MYMCGCPSARSYVWRGLVCGGASEQETKMKQKIKTKKKKKEEKTHNTRNTNVFKND